MPVPALARAMARNPDWRDRAASLLSTRMLVMDSAPPLGSLIGAVLLETAIYAVALLLPGSRSPERRSATGIRAIVLPHIRRTA